MAANYFNAQSGRKPCWDFREKPLVLGEAPRNMATLIEHIYGVFLGLVEARVAPGKGARCHALVLWGQPWSRSDQDEGDGE